MRYRLNAYLKGVDSERRKMTGFNDLKEETLLDEKALENK